MFISASDTIILFVDLQDQTLLAKLTTPPDEIRRAVELLTFVAGAVHIPIVCSVIPSGPETPFAIAECGTGQTFHRLSMGALDDPPTLEYLLRLGRKNLVISGVVSEVAILHTALAAIANGFNVYVTIDATAGITARTEQAAFDQIRQAGGVITATASLVSSFATHLSDPSSQAIICRLRSLMV